MAAPAVITDEAENVATYSATLAGRCTWVDPGAAVSYIGFEWGKTTAYGNWSPWEQALPGEAYHHDIAGLEKGTAYHFRIVGAAGALRSYGADKSFTTTTVGPPPVSTPFMGWIIDKMSLTSGWFYSIYLTVEDWVWPFTLAADFFYEVSRVFQQMAIDFYTFSLWVDGIATRIVTILSWDNIKSLFKEWLPGLEEIRDWFYAWQLHVWQELTNWWRAQSTTVLGWIEEAKEELLTWTDWLHGQIIELREDLDNLLAQIPDVSEMATWFSNWWGNILPNLTWWWDEKLLDIQALFSSWTLELEPFWAGWQDIRDKVFEFFADPWEWLYNKFDDFIERFW